MKLSEAIELERQCDELLNKAINRDAEVSLSLSGYFKITFDDYFICVNIDGTDCGYVKFTGFKSELDNYCEEIMGTIRENRELFEKLKWSYDYRSELENDVKE